MNEITKSTLKYCVLFQKTLFSCHCHSWNEKWHPMCSIMVQMHDNKNDTLGWSTYVEILFEKVNKNTVWFTSGKSDLLGVFTKWNHDATQCLHDFFMISSPEFSAGRIPTDTNLWSTYGTVLWIDWRQLIKIIDRWWVVLVSTCACT